MEKNITLNTTEQKLIYKVLKELLRDPKRQYFQSEIYFISLMSVSTNNDELNAAKMIIIKMGYQL